MQNGRGSILAMSAQHDRPASCPAMACRVGVVAIIADSPTRLSDPSPHLAPADSKMNIGHNTTHMLRVKKRGTRGYEDVHFDKITVRIKALTDELSADVNPTLIAQLTIKNMYDGISTEQLDHISARQADSMALTHPDYSRLASRLLVSNLHKSTPNSFSECMAELGRRIGTLSRPHLDWIAAHAAELDAMIDHSADYKFDYFGYKVLERSYLHKYEEPELDEMGRPVYIDAAGMVVPHDKIILTKRGLACTKIEVITGGAIEYQMVSLRPKLQRRVYDRPQYMFMRVAIAMWSGVGTHPSVPNQIIADPLAEIARCYRELASQLYIHATPTLFNACGRRQQLGSCFLFGVGDSLVDIMDTLKDASMTSKEAGGIGFWYHKIRPSGAMIKGTNGPSSGIVKQLKMFNDAAVTWDQGTKRKGAFAVYLEPWHGDIMRFLKMKLNNGIDDERARDLFYALWVPDLFVKRARAKKLWSLFSADDAPGLCDVYDGMSVCKHCGWCSNPNYAKYCSGVNGLPTVLGIFPCPHSFILVDAFTRLYEDYEADGMAIDTIRAQDVMNAICDAQRESGTPYICFKDHVNRASNQQNIDTIRSSNLCAEIMEVSTENDYAACTLASVNLPKFVRGLDANMTFDHAALHQATRGLVRNLNRVIDVGSYPVTKCSRSSYGHRPIAIGVQGLADVFAMMRIPFLSQAAARLDLDIAETMYHAAVTESALMAVEFGSYDGFDGSPVSLGILQPDMWRANNNYAPKMQGVVVHSSGRYDMGELARVAARGMHNSLLRGNMPTVATSQILGNNESFEPFSSNLYTKDTIAGKFTVINRHMVKHLIELGQWNEATRLQLGRGGSIAALTHLPADVRELYKTVYEMTQSDIMRRAAMRGAFVDQSQSLNIHLRSNTNAMLAGVFYAGWDLGLKTGSYYVRTEVSVEAMKNNIAAKAAVEPVVVAECDMCSA